MFTVYFQMKYILMLCRIYIIAQEFPYLLCVDDVISDRYWGENFLLDLREKLKFLFNLTNKNFCLLNFLIVVIIMIYL